MSKFYCCYSCKQIGETCAYWQIFIECVLSFYKHSRILGAEEFVHCWNWIRCLHNKLAKGTVCIHLLTFWKRQSTCGRAMSTVMSISDYKSKPAVFTFSILFLYKQREVTTRTSEFVTRTTEKVTHTGEEVVKQLSELKMTTAVIEDPSLLKQKLVDSTVTNTTTTTASDAAVTTNGQEVSVEP